MRKNHPSFWRRHRWLTVLMGAFLAVVIGAGAALAVIARHIQPYLRARLVSGLEQRFNTHVELDRFHVALGNGFEGEWGIWATGRGLRIWPSDGNSIGREVERGGAQGPLLALDEFRFHVPLRYQPGRNITISRVRLSGLKIDVPPASQRNKTSSILSAPATARLLPVAVYRASSAARPGDRQRHAGTRPGQGSANDQSMETAVLASVLVKRIDCENAQLILETDKPGKLPLSFAISQVQLRNVTAGQPIEFEAELTNPKPVGVIHAAGSLGPWPTDDPGETPIRGRYAFSHADLSTFRGIAGILSSTGNFEGTLRTLAVDGDADVPDFRLTHFGNAEPLHTHFHARVDGTNGDTWLDAVDATLGNSHLLTRGQVVRVRPRDSANAQPYASANLPPLADSGHDITLKVDVDQGRIEDFLRLANRSQAPLLTGTIALNASLHIPPGADPVYQRLQAHGTFKLDQARFTDQKLQSHILDLSLRGLGRPGAIKTSDAGSISSSMEGAFHMAGAVITLPDLQYKVPGAAIQLEGKYPLEGALSFDGTARMQATVSQMIGGWKGLLLRPADRLFRGAGAGTVVPILIRGPHDAPEFSVDFERLKHTSPQTPGQK
ncbi:MAG TPA: AsmA-like C-terminal region-containing protein [Terracidiphilus sp.]|nr:AsmA-like C-terminal region-containing protein [Terracidiphilus sp.]